jgi:ribosomal protein S18 acetylase RimI-like enzyme
MPEIRSLAGESGNRIFEAFAAAFADYSVPVDMSKADFDEDNARRGLDPAISLGAYQGDRLVGFVMNGRGTWAGRPAAYDVGTGVLPEARGAGLAGTLAARLVEFLPSRGLELYVLEVIRDNLAAFKTYQKAGFCVTRSLECLRGAYADTGRSPPAGLDIVELPSGKDFPCAAAGACRDWEPTWQNSDESIARTPGRTIAVGAQLDGKLSGYIVSSPNGVLWQLAVGREHRGRGIGSALLRELARRVGPSMRYINVQADDIECLRFLTARGLRKWVGQYEMLRELASCQARRQGGLDAGD